MVALRNKVDDRFYGNIFVLFDKLGELDSEETANLKQFDREAWQYVTFDSLYRKMDKIFGVQHYFFALMLFKFLSDRKPTNTRINYKMFLEKLMPLWPKNHGEILHHQNQVIIDIYMTGYKKQRNQEINGLCFDIMNLSGNR
jgi:hypothetical protein